MASSEEWIQNTLYSELIANPIWLHAAFTRDGQFSVDQNGIRLIHYLVTSTRAKCPSWDNWKAPIDMDEYTKLVRVAWNTTRDMWWPRTSS